MSEGEGFVKLWRRAALHPILRRGPAFALFFRLVAEAQYRETEVTVRGRTTRLQRGQALISIRRLVEDEFGSRQAIRKLLDEFISAGMIEVRPQLREVGLLVTVLNYDAYQAPHNTYEESRGPQKTGSVKQRKRGPQNGPQNEPVEPRHINGLASTLGKARATEPATGGVTHLLGKKGIKNPLTTTESDSYLRVVESGAGGGRGQKDFSRWEELMIWLVDDTRDDGGTSAERERRLGARLAPFVAELGQEPVERIIAQAFDRAAEGKRAGYVFRALAGQTAGLTRRRAGV